MTDIAENKKRLRSLMKARRLAAFEAHGLTAGAALAAHGIGFAASAGGATVSGFLAIGEEIDTMPLMARLIGEGATIGLPVMIGKGKPLVFRGWAPGEPLDAVQWGIREPVATAPVVVPDVMLVPLLAFDRRGYRLGYGGGFYDRSLAEIKASKPVLTIGLAYDELEVDAVPYSHYDEPLDWVLTPSGPIRCGAD